MSVACAVKENGKPQMIPASQATVVAPWAKWAWIWHTSGDSSKRSANATACRNSLKYTPRGWDHDQRARMACASAAAAARANPSGRRRAHRNMADLNVGRVAASHASRDADRDGERTAGK